ncbi:MAG: hypothetical protein NVSMB18_26690 [Acetobacteraceae bacterium]
MTDSTPKPTSSPNPEIIARAEREAAALRRNLLLRKQQARIREAARGETSGADEDG